MDEHRRQLHEAIIVGLREISRGEYAAAINRWMPHDPGELIPALLEITAAILSSAASFGLPIKKEMADYIDSAPPDRRPAVQTAGDLVLAVTAGRSPGEQPSWLSTHEEVKPFLDALSNIAVHFIRRLTLRHQMIEGEWYDAAEDTLRKKPSGGGLTQNRGETRVFEIRIRVGDPPTNVDPDDTTGAGYRPGTLDTWEARLIEEIGDTGREGHRILETLGHHTSREAAAAAVEKRKQEEPTLQDVPLRYID